MGMNEFTTQNITEIHNDIIERYGGTKGILNQGTIDYLVYLLNTKRDVFKKAALVMEQIIIGHPFMDGNKRTAFEVTDILLRGNGYHIHAAEEEILHALLKIAKYECTVEEIEKWLRKKVLSLELG
ncbi:MAG: type II toxin-antitoxin system death-on-curing family toxin [Euryarchaeota archaeon]|nr:type II toxin-antitoxin system death-on-curing family toxin [Euryarchaeota archaeon]MBU4339887.1 type II toxin-antitoxin system death-on-curing family toxin [Euryarchaeota archaeon]MBU4453644.1 type II toxin-antitoxin system death-on-curing family toxin [Euryarchaeota archaeon]MCG2735276.1 type II toxin-antitoxin system death-on-curing family toxin [Candidatus Methanoperedenaceae archaeon]MDP3104050.1 type II toxin-antitoxin system death-on-curing family toxin [Candidatus Methanoperedens sp.